MEFSFKQRNYQDANFILIVIYKKISSVKKFLKKYTPSKKSIDMKDNQIFDYTLMQHKNHISIFITLSHNYLKIDWINYHNTTEVEPNIRNYQHQIYKKTYCFHNIVISFSTGFKIK